MARGKNGGPITRAKSYLQNSALIIVKGFYDPYHDISSVFISNKTVSVANSPVAAKGGGGGGGGEGRNHTLLILILSFFLQAG